MDIIFQSSQDLPWEDTNYEARLYNPSDAINDVSVTITCEKVQVKRYEEFTYFRLILPLGMIFSTEKDILLVLKRDDNCEFRIQQIIKSNITRVETTELKWTKWEINTPNILDQMRRMLPIDYPQPDLNPRWIPEQGDNIFHPGTSRLPIADGPQISFIGNTTTTAEGYTFSNGTIVRLADLESTDTISNDDVKKLFGNKNNG